MPEDAGEDVIPASLSQAGIPELDQHEVHAQAAGQEPSSDSPPSMTPREQELWSMPFEELYQEAKRHGFGSSKFGKGKSESRKNGRVQILRWILKKEGITPYSARRERTANDNATTGDSSSSSARNPCRKNRNGAVDHPEAILQTTDAALQRQIAEAEANYLKWTPEALTTLAMQRSYQIFKDSAGKMPTRAKPALAQWLAAWDVLKSPREKRWWLGDGIDLVNKAKAMGYEGRSTKKYDVIVWLRSTPEEAETWAAHVAEPTATKPLKRRADGTLEDMPVSKRPAKGSRRPGGWKHGLDEILDG